MAFLKKIQSLFLMIFLVCAACFSVSDRVHAEKRQYVVVENGVSRTDRKSTRLNSSH